MKRAIIPIILLFFFHGFLLAQESGGSVDSLVVIDDLELIGNKITTERILYREITFNVGDTLNIADYKQRKLKSEENLMNTSLFNFAKISDSIFIKDHITYAQTKVEVTERWYIWPLPILELAERNFNAWWETKDLGLLNYGIFMDWQNFRGRKEQLKLLLQLGYDEKLGLSYTVPYINKKQTVGLSMGFNQTKNHQTSYFTENNRVERVRLPIEYAQVSYHAFLAISHRASIYKKHYLEVSYNERNFADTIFTLNPDFYSSPNTKAQYMKLSYSFKDDHRDYKSFPLKGYYWDVLIEKKGFGLFEESNISLLSAKFNIRKYWKLDKRLFFAAGIAARVANDKNHPYFLSTGLGYGRDFVRGYEFYVVDGQDYALLKTDLKFELVPQQVMKIKFIPTEKFNKIPWALYLSIFSDLAYSPGDRRNGNSLQNDMLHGYGAGINLVTYYDVVIRFEYSFNKMKESGFFIHFMASI